MNDQPRLEALEEGHLLRDGERQPPPHTVPAANFKASTEESIDGLSEETAVRSGHGGGGHPPQIPPLWSDPEELAAVLHHGQSRFEIFCAPCHGLTGTGYGMVPQRGFPFPPSYHTPRLRSKPLGYIFAVATHGRGRMPPYGELLSTEDRWAVAAYVRTLQLSQYTPSGWLDAAEKQHLDQQHRDQQQRAQQHRDQQHEEQP